MEALSNERAFTFLLVSVGMLFNATTAYVIVEALRRLRKKQ